MDKQFSAIFAASGVLAVMGSNFSAKILNNAVSSLNAAQASIGTVSNNIGNVNTEGYTRRVLDLENRQSRNVSGGIDVGSGVSIAGITRISEQFLEDNLRLASSRAFDAETQQELLSRVESLFSLTGEVNTIGGTLTAFFNSLDDLTQDPSSIELRSEVLERATDLVDTIQNTYNTVADLQDEIDDRIESELGTVNSLTSQIADLNGQIQAKEGAGNLAADERDRRDFLIKRLSEKIGFNAVETGDGTVTITLQNGFSLVNNTTSRDLEAVPTPSFSAAPPQSLSGAQLNYIVYDYDTSGGSPAHIDLTSMLKDGGGVIGGLLSVRGTHAPADTSAFDADGPLVAIAERVESVSQMLLTTFNQQYLGPDYDAGTPLVHEPSAVDLNNNTPGVFGFFTATGVADGNANGLPDTADFPAGTDSLSRSLSLVISDPRQIAAALANTTPPAAQAGSPGDGRNIENLVLLQNNSSLTFSVNGGGSYSQTGTFNEVYNETVNYVSNAKSRKDLEASTYGDQLVTAQSARDSESAVSLDEEFTSLIKFQKAFQASSRVIRVATELLDTIASLI